jgi:DNA-binding HxlR family transcriptional regulator/putative sterol carrier protein
VADFRYEQFCPLARAAEILGERWTLLVLRELVCGPQRYSDLRRRLPGVSSSVLSQRLERLCARGLVAREDQPPPAPVALYRLTDEGEALRPVLRELMRFGARHLEPPRPGDHLEPEWLPVAMEFFARSGPVPRRDIAIEIPDGDRDIGVRVTGGRRGTRIGAGRGPAEVTLRAGPLVLLGLLTGQLDPQDALGAGQVEVEGDVSALRDLPALFDLRDVMARPAKTG